MCREGKHMGTVSVIIPVRNGAHEISDQLDALCAQTDSDFEVIISDNGSTDNLKEVLARYKDRLNLRHVDASAQRGVAYARNAGARASQSDYVMVCDADDMVCPQWVEAYRRYLDDNPKAIYSGSMVTVDPAEKSFSQFTPVDQVEPDSKPLDPTSMCGGNFGIAREVWWQNDGFREDFVLGGAEDVDFALRAVRNNIDVVWIREAEILYAARPTVWTSFQRGRGYGRGNLQLWREYGPDVKNVNLRHSICTFFKVLPKMATTDKKVAKDMAHILGVHFQYIIYLLSHRQIK